LYYTTLEPSQRGTILWGGPPGPRPTPWSACSNAQRAGGGPARTGASAPHLVVAVLLCGAGAFAQCHLNKPRNCNCYRIRGADPLVRAGPPDPLFARRIKACASPTGRRGRRPADQGVRPTICAEHRNGLLSGIGRFRLPTGFFTSFSDGVHHRGQGVNHRGNPHGRQNSLLADAFFAQHLLVRIDAHTAAVDGRNRQAP